MDDVLVYLVPIGAGRFELFTEPPGEDEPGVTPHEHDSFARRWRHRLHERWRQLAHDAAHPPQGAATGRFARARDWLVRHITESIDEQRTLWSLRAVTSATLVHPDDLSSASASETRGRLLVQARRYHGCWLLVDLCGVAATAILVLLPGPNLIGYYFVFRVVGHYLSWQGARHALVRTAWRTRPEAAPVFQRIVLYTRR